MLAGKCDGSAAQRLKKLIDGDVNTTHLFSFSLPFFMCLLVYLFVCQPLSLSDSHTDIHAHILTYTYSRISHSQTPLSPKWDVLYENHSPHFTTSRLQHLPFGNSSNLRSDVWWGVNIYYDCECASVNHHPEMIRRQSISTLTGKRTFHNVAQLLMTPIAFNASTLGGTPLKIKNHLYTCARAC